VSIRELHQDEKFDAVCECKHSPEAGELYFECLHRLLPELTDDQIDEVIDQGYEQSPQRGGTQLRNRPDRGMSGRMAIREGCHDAN
jgi:hypothetical protein